VSPTVRKRGAWLLLGLTLVFWPLTMFTVAKDEPPFVLALSWAAIALTAIDILATTDVREKEEE
jgi:hypothetical protein